ncbi:hypothetical protein ACFWP2_19480 [Kitasatospora sp. NPDC058444]|uniref:hypothetical protein n=1 Tax=Kitasatospora sp. NPDC058444 TaxID=3346504 RepID=UPI00365CA919
MRARLLLTGLALATTVLVGGAATAQAAPAPHQGDTVSAAVPGYWKKMGIYTKSACYDLRDSYAGDAYCSFVGTNRYALYIWVG